MPGVCSTVSTRPQSFFGKSDSGLCDEDRSDNGHRGGYVGRPALCGSSAHTIFQLVGSSRPANSLSHLSRTGRTDGCGLAGATIP